MKFRRETVKQKRKDFLSLPFYLTLAKLQHVIKLNSKDVKDNTFLQETYVKQSKLLTVVITFSLLSMMLVGCARQNPVPAPAPAPAPAQFELANLTVSPEVATAGESCTVSMDVANIGEVEDVYEVILKLNGQVVEKKYIAISPGTTERVSFTIDVEMSGLPTGEHTLSVGKLSASRCPAFTRAS